ncbi:nucleoside-diphosphate sugar epimerase [Pseudonocardia sulfidoxydans NBRC 16205]|uniref:Nucleoside-diphosphate sugar epimerase n=1 Tax=Pseudonocardia sulfidoxydans NBRC 16205 TaxID=1223511 RepID=A0A511DG27_9PSEU|nr:NmrA family NAD(P)-binding protein [Pseudonocardia sulfidoxydans]GEL23746.1 nucleoside-diphosphate sugar epimerase [Pseudonocardia sulfidoxydans NBRC 16205]
MNSDNTIGRPDPGSRSVPREASGDDERFVVTAATSATGSAVVEHLLDAGAQVVAVARDVRRLGAAAGRGARTFTSALDDADRLTDVLADASGAFVMLAPGLIPDCEDFASYQRAVIAAQAGAVGEAFRRGRLRRVVTLSGWAANYTGARGPVWGLRHLEEAIDATGIPAMHLRAGWFMENLLPDVATLRATGELSGLLPASLPLPMIAVADIARVAAELLLGVRPFAPGRVQVTGPADRSLAEAATAIGTAAGIPGARYVELTEETLRTQLRRAGFSEHMADGTVAMTLDVAAGRIHIREADRSVTTTTTLEQFLSTAVGPTARHD